MSPFTIDDARHAATLLVERYAARDEFNENVRRAFHMEWQEKPKADWIKPTMSPSAHNSGLGAIRLLTATEPQITVPYAPDDDLAKTASEAIEVACKAIWDGSGRVAGRPVHYEAATSAILFGEICASVTRSADLVAYAEKAQLRGRANRMRHLAARTPYYIKLYDPSKVYPDIDRFGLARIVSRQRTTWGELLDAWGKLAEDAQPAGDVERSTPVTVCDYYDWQYRAVWVEEAASKELVFEEHGLEFLPFVAQITDGSFMFDYDKPELQRIPLLYSLLKSGLWYRENLSLTTIFSLIYALGSAPLTVRRTNNKEDPVVVDRSVPGGMINIGPDEQLNPFVEKIIDPSLTASLDIARQIGNESTIQPQALGAPPQGSMAFSSISLLAQAGRLPLVSHKEMMGHAAAELLTMCLRWMKADRDSGTFYKRDRSPVKLSYEDIPDEPVVRVVIEPDLPQDRLSAANVALMLVNGKLASRDWVRENILNMGQPGLMDASIWTEQRMDVELARLVEKLKALDQVELQNVMAQLQAQAQGGPPQGAGGDPPTGPVTPAQASGAYPPGGQVGGAGMMPLQGPLPAGQ